MGRLLTWTASSGRRTTYRHSFTQVVLLPVVSRQLKVINPWLEDDQVESASKQLTASFPGTGLIQNNRSVLTCYWKAPVLAITAKLAQRAHRAVCGL